MSRIQKVSQTDADGEVGNDDSSVGDDDNVFDTPGANLQKQLHKNCNLIFIPRNSTNTRTERSIKWERKGKLEL